MVNLVIDVYYFYNFHSSLIWKFEKEEPLGNHWQSLNFGSSEPYCLYLLTPIKFLFNVV